MDMFKQRNKHSCYTITIMLLLTLTFTANLTLAQNSLKVTIQTDKASYQLRELVNMYGNVTYNDNLVDAGLVAIQVEDPNKTIVIRTIPANTTPNQDWNIQIMSFIPCDDLGNPKTIFQRGKWATFKVTVKNNLPIAQKILVVINVYDSTMIPIEISAVQFEMSPGGIDVFMPSIWIEEWATTGNATAYANVYSDWPKNDGYPYCPEKTTTFQIVSFEGESPKTEKQEFEIIETNASYQAFFRLSPGPPPGVYHIYVTALHRGWKVFNSKIFLVTHAPTPPRASFAYWPPQAAPGVEITFDASSSTAEGYNDTITSYNWHFGDNQTGSGAIIKHTYQSPGNYTVILNVTDSEGFWNTTSQTVQITIIHDVAVLDVKCLNEIYSDWLTVITITVKNNGTAPESFNVKAYYNNITIGTVTINNLGPLSQLTVNINWNTSGLTPYTSYMIWTAASVVQNEINLTNNVFEFGEIWVKILADINNDRKIDIYDVVMITSIYGAKRGDSIWNPQIDLNPDGKIDIYDVVVATSKYGYKYAS